MKQPATIQKEKTLARYVLGISSVVMLFVWNATASTPSHLSHTLKAQQDVVADRPYDSEAYNDLGNLLALDERHSEAEEAYRKAIELAPTDTLARFNLGVLLQQEGRSRDAQKEFRSLLEIDDRHGKAYYQLGMLFESRGQRGRAVEHYARAFAFDPDLTFAYNNPHLIDNTLATEAMLKSERYESSPSAETPRLYGDPERIASLMLSNLEATDQPVAVADFEDGDDDDDEDEAPVERVGRRAHFGDGGESGRGGAPAGGPAPRSRASSQNSNSVGTPAGSVDGRRVLTPSDLDAGSNQGQAQRVGGGGRRRPAIGVGDRSGGRNRASGRVDSQPTAGQRGAVGAVPPGGTSASDSTAGNGRTSRSRRPSYRPRSRLSTGRLELKLLPPTAETERYADLRREESVGK